MASAAEGLSDFPVSHLLPKKETSAYSFLKKYPKYNGDGTVIAIFDSGVDPAAQGMQICPNGDVKVIDRINASGAGDVDTSVVVKAQPGDSIVGITGRMLEIPKDWTCPSGEFHLGVRSAYTLYNSKVKDGIARARKEEIYEPEHKKYYEAAMRRLQVEKNRSSNSSSPVEDSSESAVIESDAEKKTGKCSADCDSAADTKSSATEGNSVSGCESSNPCTSEPIPHSDFLEKQQKDEAEAEVFILNNLAKKISDLGPAYDCVVYHDGKNWRACIDTSEVGELHRGVNLGEYRKTYEHSFLTPKDNYTISVNVYNEGDLLEIVGLCSSHGTHVAAIAAAYIPDDPDRCGVAPGAKIVSISISDCRLGGMETGTGLARAMSWVCHNPYYNIDIINMSYGEHSTTINSGRLGELASDVVNRFGKLWIASASNHGPGLSTIGCPPDFFHDCVMGIGAHISNDMKQHMHSMLEKNPSTTYTWSSRGPTKDGALGVSVCAPGGAITSVPAFTNKCDYLMNGTSMAAPNAAGCAALLLSAMKHEKMLYSPFLLRRAIENTALKLSNLKQFAQGHGLFQVEKAYEYLQEFGTKSDRAQDFPPEDNMRYIVECNNNPGHKGVYLRNWTAKKISYNTVSITPVQLNHAKGNDDQKRKLSMDMVLSTDYFECPWLKHPTVLHMAYTPRTFSISVDPSGLKPGEIYSTIIKAFIKNNIKKGPQFIIPVTVCVPIIDLDYGHTYISSPQVFHAADIKRKFLMVPNGATHCTLTLTLGATDQIQKIIIHAIQLVPMRSIYFSDFYRSISNASPHDKVKVVFPVEAEVTLEICVARWWQSVNDISLQFEATFHGIMCTTPSICMTSSCSVQRVDIHTKLRCEELSFSGSLNRQVVSVVPFESRVEVLGGVRDTQPDYKPVYQMEASYAFSVTKATEISPKCAPLADYLYESSFESQLWMLYDNKKQLVSCGDAFPAKYSVKVEKGDYVLRFHLRHYKSELLEKMQDLPMTISFKINDIPLYAYWTHQGAVTGGRKFGNCVLSQTGDINPLYIATPNIAEHRSVKHNAVAPGHILTGTVTFAKDDSAKKACHVPIQLMITEVSSAKKKPPAFMVESDKKESKSITLYNDAVRDLAVTWINKLDFINSEQVYYDALKNHPEHVKLHHARLNALDSFFSTEGNRSLEGSLTSDDTSTSGKTYSSSGFAKDWVDAVTPVAQKIQKLVDLNFILASQGTKTDTRSDAAKHKTMVESHKQALLDSFCKLGMAIMAPFQPPLVHPASKPRKTDDSPFPIYDITVRPKPTEAILNQLDLMATQLLKLTEPTDSRVFMFFVMYYSCRRFHASAAKLLLKQMDERPSKETYLLLLSQVRLLGFHHVVSDMCRGFPLKYPEKFLPL